jgi:hypothetical protein
MALKELFAPHLNRTVKMGRVWPRALGPQLSLRTYFRGVKRLPAAPANKDYSGKALSVLRNIYLNDSLGDCVIAGGYHIVGTETGNAGDLFKATNTQLIKDYSAIGGYVPGDKSTDNGCDEITALNYWVDKGFANGVKVAGYLSVDPSNEQEIKTALYLFENLFFAFDLPAKWVSPMPEADGFVWDTAGPPVKKNGHVVAGVGYDKTGVKFDSWGLFGKLTWAAIAKYCAKTAHGGLYVILTPDQIRKGQKKAPNGLDWTALIKDFNSLGGNIPPPKPPKTSEPTKIPRPTKTKVPKIVKTSGSGSGAPPGLDSGGTGTTEFGPSYWAPPAYSYPPPISAVPSAPSVSPLPLPLGELGQRAASALMKSPSLAIVGVVGLVVMGVVGIVALSDAKE